MDRTTVTLERERMQREAGEGFPALPALRAGIAGIADIERRHRERRAAEAACRERIAPIRAREVELGLRVLFLYRAPLEPGTRVLANYPPREGVVVAYEETDGRHGGPMGGWSFVRHAYGSVGHHLDETLFSLDVEAGGAR